MALQLANWAYTLLSPGGKFILGNFSSEEPGECLCVQIKDMCSQRNTGHDSDHGFKVSETAMLYQVPFLLRVVNYT